jgi:hypothetical protein
VQCRGPAARRDACRVGNDPRGQLAVSRSERRARSVGETYTDTNTEGDARAHTDTAASPDRNAAPDRSANRQADTKADADRDPITDPITDADVGSDPESDADPDAWGHHAPGHRRLRQEHRLRLRLGV